MSKFLYAVMVMCLFAVSSATWWNATYNYRAPVSLTNWDCVAATCQFPIYVGLNNTVTNGSEIRVINSADTAELQFWREDGWNYTNASGYLWVNATNQTSQFYIYYNATGAADKSSVDETFYAGDDFNGAAFNTSKWTNVGGYAIAQSSGYVNWTGGWNPYDGIYLTYKPIPAASKVIAKFIDMNGCLPLNDCRSGINVNRTDGTSYKMLQSETLDSSINSWFGTNNGTAIYLPVYLNDTIFEISSYNWAASGAIVASFISNLNRSVNYSFDTQATDSNYASPLFPYMGVHNGKVDWFIVTSVPAGSLNYNSSAGGALGAQQGITGSSILANITLVSPANGAVINSANVSFEFNVSTSLNATDGEVTYDGLYTIRTFRSSGIFTANATGTNVSVLIVGGGGAGRNGGGGAGGLIYIPSYLANGSIPVIVGNGGAGAQVDIYTNATGGDGGNSSFDSLIAIGGGGGANTGNGGTINGSSGGSGGGGGSFSAAYTYGGFGTAGQGSNGGGNGGNMDVPYASGGGGGAGSAGSDAISSSVSGAGGTGLQYSISGSMANYSCGGGGGVYENVGISGGGGCSSGGSGSISGSGGNGGDNTGSGGGGTGNNQMGGNGGSGVVIVRYLTSDESGNATPINVTVNLYVDGVLNQSYYQTTGSTYYNITNALTDGSHTWWVFVSNSLNSSDNTTSAIWTYTALPVNYSIGAPSSEGNQSDLYAYAHIGSVNVTSGAVSDVAEINATITLNGISYAATATNTSGATRVYSFTASILPPEQAANAQANYSVEWNYTILFTNGSSVIATRGYNITAFHGGFNFCIGNYTAKTLNITAMVESTNVSISATYQMSTTYTGTSRARTSYATGTGMNLTLCIDPTNRSYIGNVALQTNASGYNLRTNIFTATFNSTMQTYVVSLLNSSIGSYYTFTIVDDTNVVVGDALISAYRFNYLTGQNDLVAQSLTNPDGTAAFFLEPLVTYTITITKNGFTPRTFVFVPASVTTLQVKIYRIIGTANFTDYTNLFADISIHWLPIATSFNVSTNISFSIVSSGGHLQYFGWTVTRLTNGTTSIVDTQNVSGNVSGGTLRYEVPVNATGTYYFTAFFKHSDYAERTSSMTYFYTYSSRGRFNLGDYMSGWSYLFITIFLVMLASGYAMRYSIEGASFVGLLIFWFMAISNPVNTIATPFGAGSPITMIHIAILTTLLVVAAWMIKVVV